MTEWLNNFNAWIWGTLVLWLIVAVGGWLTVRLRFMSLTQIPYGFRQLIRGRSGQGQGTIAPFSALMLSLSATVGTGNIVGVATAIGLGGPGALFWMWCSAILGMATKYAEAVCAVHFREKSDTGQYIGGPMYYIRNGLGPRWAWLGIAFAIFGACAGFGIGNTVQANSVADALEQSFGLNRHITWIALVVLVSAVLLGGVKRIAQVARKLVPIMAGGYLLCGLAVLIAHIGALPAAFALIIDSAFNPVAAQGGFAGAVVAMAIRYGIARGVFSNEAGLGSAPIAHAAAATDNPVRQGTVAMLGTFIDTLVICSITGLAIIVTGVWSGDAKGVMMSQAAFNMVIPYGDKVVSVALGLFALTTILGWSYYSERCVEFLLGSRAVFPFRIAWVLALPLGVQMSLGVVWTVADIMNALMAIPNLIALLALSGLVAKLTREYFANSDKSNQSRMT